MQLLLPDDSNGSYCIAHSVQGIQSYDPQEVLTMLNTILLVFLANKYGLVIIDPSFHMCSELEHLERTLKAELDLIPGSKGGFNGLQMILFIIFTS